MLSLACAFAWSYASLMIFRTLQGLGLGGEWGGAALLAVENAPPGRRAWYGIFPQLGAPVGFVLSIAGSSSRAVMPGIMRPTAPRRSICW